MRIHCRVGRHIGETLLAEDDLLDGGEVVPGFRCRLADLFADLRH